jgi:hypothetical protein
LAVQARKEAGCRISRRALVIAIAVLGLGEATGCPDSNTCEDYSPPATFDPNTPSVTFSGSVMPVFAASCAFTSCHGSPSNSNNGIYLGDPDPKKTHDALVNVGASELSSMPYVTPGDPRRSFLMRKLDGSQCVLDAQCAGGSCGERMPRDDQPLPLDTRDAIRRWIAQGAKND